MHHALLCRFRPLSCCLIPMFIPLYIHMRGHQLYRDNCPLIASVWSTVHHIHLYVPEATATPNTHAFWPNQAQHLVTEIPWVPFSVHHLLNG